ncbi:MAG TPA: tetratricopeptide repeat protein [bacterium]|nr:tetratricopeptide repeat protein [bacterium]HPO52704.1 tetratricopeptide repeat protein [bacterium]
MGAAFFLALWITLVFIILGIEFYYYILARYLEKDLTALEGIVFIILFCISIVIFAKSWAFFSGLISIALLPAVDLVIRAIVESKEKALHRLQEQKNLENWLYTIEKHPGNVNAYISIGDIYFQKRNYQQALIYYKKAQEIMDLPYIKEKIGITEKEIAIKNGVIWVCPECSFDNLGEFQKCKVCGYSKIDRNILAEIKRNKKEILKACVWILIGPFTLILFFALYVVMPIYLALIITLAVIYFTIRYFITY